MKNHFWAASAALALGVLAPVAAQAQAEVTLRCQHFLPPSGSVPAMFMEPWAAAIEEQSGGRIDVELYPAMQLGGAPPALYDQIREDQMAALAAGLDNGSKMYTGSKSAL